MFKGNLLPPKEKEKLSGIKRKFHLLIFSFLFIVVGIIAYTALFLLSQNLELHIKTLEGEIELQKRKNVELENLEREISTLEGRLGLIDKLKGNQTSWSEILRELGRRSPAGTFVTAFSKEQEKFKISGIAPSRKAVAQLKDNLEDSSYFSKVEFVSSSLISPDKSTSLVDFSFYFILEKRTK